MPLLASSVHYLYNALRNIIIIIIIIKLACVTFIPPWNVQPVLKTIFNASSDTLFSKC